ncbi:MAG TPA: NAD(P)H-hydrate epimerase [Sedimentisphaerales bacterium]|nr:NAD(P)H-hydrate epimerase [Sedimentisphaerales bacterium]
MERYTPAKGSRVMSRDEVRRVDAWAIEEVGIPGVVLMENAGRSCAELAMRKLAQAADRKVCVFCGVGNNGGDGYVIARHLLNAGIPTTVVLCGDRAKVQGDARINLDVLERLGHRVECVDPLSEGAEASIRRFGGDASLIVDALFGTGLRGQLRPEYLAVVEAVNALGRPILAVDIPSGLDCDTGRPLGAAIRAAYTVTFVAVKKGFLASPEAEGYVGEFHVASIGVEPPMQ